MMSSFISVKEHARQCKILKEELQKANNFTGQLMEERDAAWKEIESLRYQLYNILAILNRDGGHYREKHGTAAAIENGLRMHYEYAQQADKCDKWKRRATFQRHHLIQCPAESIADYDNGWEEFCGHFPEAETWFEEE